MARKNFGAKPFTYPQPVFIIAAYGENDIPSAMNAAWGGISDYKEITMDLSKGHKTVQDLRARGAFTVSMGTLPQLVACDYVGVVSGNKEDKSGAFAWTTGENGAPLIDAAKVSIELSVEANHETEGFDNFFCKILATYAEESVLNDQGKLDYHVFKPVLFEFPTYEYFVTGDCVGACARMNG